MRKALQGGILIVVIGQLSGVKKKKKTGNRLRSTLKEEISRQVAKEISTCEIAR